MALVETDEDLERVVRIINETEDFRRSPPWDRSAPLEDAPEHPPIPPKPQIEVPTPDVGAGPSDAYGMNTLGDLGDDDAPDQPAPRGPRRFLGEPGKPLASHNKDSQAVIWNSSAIFEPPGPRGENWMCFAKPKRLAPRAFSTRSTRRRTKYVVTYSSSKTSATATNT
jgi:hypothetical protein